MKLFWRGGWNEGSAGMGCDRGAWRRVWVAEARMVRRAVKNSTVRGGERALAGSAHDRGPARAPPAGGVTARTPRRSWRAWFRVLIRFVVPAVLVGPLLLIFGFRFLPPPLTPLMVIRMAEGHALHRQWVPYEKIAPVLAESVIAAEDNHFCEESLGFDFKALQGQFAAWAAGERPRGASTITTQTAKNLLLWPGRDPVRKLIEAWLTPQFAMLWPKRRVLEVYLNIVEFGPGIYGAEAAAKAFFGIRAADLSPRQAALLASVLPLPLQWSAASPSPHLRYRAQVIEQRVEQIQPLLTCAQWR
jgi:monofunctional glycosyltransferase